MVEAGAKLTKGSAYRALADYVNSRLHLKWTAKDAKVRYESLLRKYKTTKKEYEDTTGGKFSLTREESEAKVTIGAHIFWRYIFIFSRYFFCGFIFPGIVFAGMFFSRYNFHFSRYVSFRLTP